MYQYLFVMKYGCCYGLPENSIMNKKQVEEFENICCVNNVDYIIIDLYKAFDPFGKDAITISQSCIDNFGKEGVNNYTES